MPGSFDLPVLIGPAGAQPTPPAVLNQQLVAAVQAEAPGYTVLPANMVEDLSSTATNGLAINDQGRVETLNSLAPTGANVALLQSLGGMLGIIYGQPTNTSVQVVFTGTVGYIIPNGLLVSDGTNTYQVNGGGVVASTGNSGPIPAIAIAQGSWAVPAGTVTQIQSSIPSSITLTVTNPSAGTPGNASPEAYYSYRSRVQNANLAACAGGPRFAKTGLGNVPGVPSNLISVQQVTGGLKVVVGGSGDIYQIANAIYMGVGDPSVLQGSSVSSGRNQTVSLIDYPDTYSILYVSAVAQTVAVSITWNTILTDFASGAAFPSLIQSVIANYIAGLPIAGVINFLEMQALVQTAVSGLLPAQQLTRLVFGITINGSPVTPGTGQDYVSGDVEGYFTIQPSNVSVTQG